MLTPSMLESAIKLNRQVWPTNRANTDGQMAELYQNMIDTVIPIDICIKIIVHKCINNIFESKIDIQLMFFVKWIHLL